MREAKHGPHSCPLNCMKILQAKHSLQAGPSGEPYCKPLKAPEKHNSLSMGLQERLSSTRGLSVKMQPPSQAVFKGPFVSSETTQHRSPNKPDARPPCYWPSCWPLLVSSIQGPLTASIFSPCSSKEDKGGIQWYSTHPFPKLTMKEHSKANATELRAQKHPYASEMPAQC